MPSHTFRIPATACLVASSIVLSGCGAPLRSPPAQAKLPAVTTVIVEDLRAPKWRDMQVVDTGAGVVQYTGDQALPGGVITHLQQRLSMLPTLTPASKVALKTADVRLSIPDVQLSITLVVSDSVGLAVFGTLISVPISGLLSSVSRNKSASAVFCISVDGQDYFASDARLFRIGAESELKDSIEAALQLLLKRVESRTPATSVACEPGWEGGQPRPGE